MPFLREPVSAHPIFLFRSRARYHPNGLNPQRTLPPRSSPATFVLGGPPLVYASIAAVTASAKALVPQVPPTSRVSTFPSEYTFSSPAWIRSAVSFSWR